MAVPSWTKRWTRLKALVVELFRFLWQRLFKSCKCPKWVQLSSDGKVVESLEHWRESSGAEMVPCRAVDWPSPDREFEEITFIGSYTGRRSRTWVTLTCAPPAPPPSPHPNPFNPHFARCPHPLLQDPPLPFTTASSLPIFHAFQLSQGGGVAPGPIWKILWTTIDRDSF